MRERRCGMRRAAFGQRSFAEATKIAKPLARKRRWSCMCQGEILMPDLRNYDEMCCPDCGRPVIVQIVSDTRVRFEGCTRRCRDKYDVPDGSILFGALGAPQFI